MFAENKPKKELIRMLQQMGYDSDPVKAWKEAQDKVKKELKKRTKKTQLLRPASAWTSGITNLWLCS